MSRKDWDPRALRRKDIEDEIKNENKTKPIIKEIIHVQKESESFFIEGIINIINQQYVVGGRVSTSFIKLLGKTLKKCGISYKGVDNLCVENSTYLLKSSFSGRQQE